MAKLKTRTGVPFRSLYSAFEIEALKYANNEDLPEGENFQYGGSNENFSVTKNTETEISIVRTSNEKTIEAIKKSIPNEDNTVTENVTQITQSIPENNENTEKTMATNVNTSQIQALSEMLCKLIQPQTTAAIDYGKIDLMIEKKLRAAQTFKVQVNDKPTVEFNGIAHAKMEEVLFWVANKQPVYLYGPAGTGKNILAQQVAESLGVPFYYAGSLQFKTDLEGFVDANGNYVETDFYKAFTGGGVFLLDEIDGTGAEVLVAFGAVLANGYYNFPKFGRLHANEKFYIIAAGNTAGRGASNAYNGRYQLDASTLDRFAFIELDYDRKIELSCAGGDNDLVEFAHTLRNIIDSVSLPYTVSTRALKRIAMARDTFPLDMVMKSALCAGWNVYDIDTIKSQITEDGSKNNKYLATFKQLK